MSSAAAVGSAGWPAPHQGMPPLDLLERPISRHEFWPGKLFYFPIALYIGALMLRHRGITVALAANPTFPAGGFVGESKSQVLALVASAAPEQLASYVSWDRTGQHPTLAAEADAMLALLQDNGLALPVVAKPDLGCRGAGVRLVRSRGDLIAYLDAFPVGHRLILQAYVGLEAEAGIFYARKPGEAQGRIISLTLKYFPYVYGDGRSTLEQLIRADPRAGQVPHLYLGRNAKRLDWAPAAGEPVRLAFAGSHSRGAIFRDGGPLVTPAMTDAFDAIAKRIDGFYFGRFDVRFTDIGDLQRGEGFKILEVNGAGAEMTHIWDARLSLRQAYQALRTQYRLLFEIGAANRSLGHRPMSLPDIWRLYRHEKRLWALYPSTD